MPKFCGFCGMQMDDNANVCGNCGTPFHQNLPPQVPTQFRTPVQPAPPVQSPDNFQPVNNPYGQTGAQSYEDFMFYPSQQPQQPERQSSAGNKNKIDIAAIISGVAGKASEVLSGLTKGNNKNILKFGGIAVAALAVIIIIISIFSGSGEEKVAKKVLKAIKNDNAEAIVKLVPKFCFSDYGLGTQKSESDWEDTFDDTISTFRSSMENQLDSDDFSMKWKISDVDFFGEENMENLSDELELYDDFKPGKLKKGGIVFAEVECKDGREEYHSEIQILVYKYGSKWCVYSFQQAYSYMN